MSESKAGAISLAKAARKRAASSSVGPSAASWLPLGILAGVAALDALLQVFWRPVEARPEWPRELPLCWCASLGVWALVLILVGTTKAFLSRPRSLGARLLIVGPGLLLTTFVVLVTTGGLVFASSFGVYPNRLHIDFVFRNLGGLSLHLLQTMPAVGLSAALFVAMIVTGLWWLARTVADEETRKRLTAVGFGGALVVTLVGVLEPVPVVQFLAVHHPLFSAAVGPRTVDAEAVVQSGPPLATAEKGPRDWDGFSPGATRTPVIVLMIESLRSDLVSLEPCPIPFLASLASRSLWFERAYVTASHSDYEDLSVWYSRYPLRSIRKNQYLSNDPARGTSTFEVFKRLGYRTAYITSQNERWGDMINWLKVPEVDHFFHSEDYEGSTWENPHDRAGLLGLIRKRVATAGKVEDTETLRIATEWIASVPHEEPFFLGMNLQNTHFNYVIPPGGPEPFQPATIDFPTPFYSWRKDKATVVRNRYYNAALNIDRAVQGFVEFLQKRGIWDRSLFVVIGDSGEAFYEHGFGNHSGPMYDEVARTLLVVKPPQGGPTGKVSHPVSHVDLFPTVFDLLGLRVHPSFQGVSALETTRSRVYLHANAFVAQDGVVAWPWKLLVTYWPRENVELLNLANDPAELENQAERDPKVVERLLTDLRRFRSLQLAYYGDATYLTSHHPPRH